MPANSTKALRIHRIDPIRDPICGFLSGLWVFCEDGSDFIEHVALTRRRKRSDVAHAPHPVDDVVVGAVLDVEEGALRPRRPVGIARPGEIPLTPCPPIPPRRV